MLKLMLYFLILIIFFSCKKDEVESNAPSIIITSPVDNQSYTALDIINIQGVVSDNKSVASISISLRNANNIKVLNSISVAPNTPSYQLNLQFPLNDLHMPSGTYTLKITASDGVNQTDKYVGLVIVAYPTVRNGLFVFSNSGTINQVVKLSNSLTPTSFSTSASDFLGGVVNSYYQQVVTCPNYTGNLIAQDVSLASTQWSIVNTSSGVPNYTGIALYENEIFVSYYNSNIKSYQNNNTPKFNAQALLNSYARKLYVHDEDLLITEQPEISGGKIRLVSYYTVSGAVKDNVELNENVVEMFSFSAQEVAVFSNAGGNGNVKLYNLYTNATWQPFALGSGLISAATEISNGIYLIAQNGSVISVNVNTFTTSTYLSNIGADLVKYDKINNEVIVTGGTILTSYDYATKTVKGTYSSPNNILAVDFLYNK